MARKERREYEKYLKKTNLEEYNKWKADNLERGKAFHQAHIDNVRAKQEEYLESKQRDIINSLRKFGKTDEEIDAYIEKWVDGLKVI